VQLVIHGSSVAVGLLTADVAVTGAKSPVHPVQLLSLAADVALRRCLLWCTVGSTGAEEVVSWLLDMLSGA